MASVALAAILVAAAAPPAAVASPGGAQLIVGFEQGLLSADLVLLNGGIVLRTIPELSLAVAWADDPTAFATAMRLDPTVRFVEGDDRLGFSGSSPTGSQWDGSQWDHVSADGSQWDGSQWDGSQWDGSQWDGSQWDGSQWDGSQWDGSQWDGSQWDGSQWDGGVMDPLFDVQWGLGAVNAPDAWTVSMGTRARTICVLDTGVDASHADLRPNLWRSPSGAFGHNAMRGGGDPGDDVGHGTHVAGIAAAVAGNGTGVAGLAQAKIMNVKVMDATGGVESDLAAGLVYCAAHGAHVASMSLHTTERSPSLERAVAHAQARGLLVVASSGNAGADRVSQPAALPGVLSVGAALPDGSVAGFSNGGDGLGLVAPGYRIASTFPDGYAIGSGTSMAAPFAAAAAALVWEADPTLDADGVKALLLSTARDKGPAGWDARYGHGTLDAGAAVLAAAAAAAAAVSGSG